MGFYNVFFFNSLVFLMSVVQFRVVSPVSERRQCRFRLFLSQFHVITGSYGIILDESHFKDLLNAHAIPQASAVSMT